MVLNGFDSVKALKAISMENYSRRRKLKWVFEFFVFSFLVFHRSRLFSLAGPALRHFFRRLVVTLNSHIFVFMFLHAMLFVIYSLSRLTDNKSGSNRAAADFETAAASSEDSPETFVAPVDDFVAEILVVGEKNAAMAPVNEVSVEELTPTPVSAVRHLNSETGMGEDEGTRPTRTQAAEMTTVSSPSSPARHLTEMTEIVPDTKRYRRTESERFEENRERSKFRRSKTEVSRIETSGEPARFLISVDEMDIEDFNKTVESFIAKQKMTIGGRISG